MRLASLLFLAESEEKNWKTGGDILGFRLEILRVLCKICERNFFPSIFVVVCVWKPADAS